MRRVVLGHQFLQFLLRRVVRIGNGDRHAGVLLDQIADRQRLVRGQQRAKRPMVMLIKKKKNHFGSTSREFRKGSVLI